MRIANKNDIAKIALIRIKQQKDDWKEQFEDNHDLLKRTKLYLEKHLNNVYNGFQYI